MFCSFFLHFSLFLGYILKHQARQLDALSYCFHAGNERSLVSLFYGLDSFTGRTVKPLKRNSKFGQ